MDSLTLRDYRPGDSEAMYALDLVCFEPPFRFSRAAMRGFAEAVGALTVLAEAQGELAGFCIAQLEKQNAYVVTLDVAPTWRRRGLARLRSHCPGPRMSRRCWRRSGRAPCCPSTQTGGSADRGCPATGWVPVPGAASPRTA